MQPRFDAGIGLRLEPFFELFDEPLPVVIPLEMRQPLREIHGGFLGWMGVRFGCRTSSNETRSEERETWMVNEKNAAPP
jgi:hypothetical protein